MKKVFVSLIAINSVLFSAHAWQRVTNGLPNNPTITQISADGNIMAMNVSSGSPIGVYLSTNGGFDWSKAANFPGSGQSATAVLVVSNKVFASRASQSAGTNVVMFTTNNGASWYGGANLPNSTTINLLSTDGAGAIFAGAQNNANVWRSTDDGYTWEQVSTAAGSFNNGPVRALGGANGVEVASASTGLYLLSGSGTNWLRSTNQGAAIAGTRMTSQGGKLFLISDAIGSRILTMADGTTNWVAAGTGLPEGYLNNGSYRDLASSASSVFVSASLLNTSFGSTPFLFQSTNGGTSWESLQLPPAGEDPRSLAVANTNLFLATYGSGAIGLYRVQLKEGVPLFPPLISSHPTSVAVYPGATVNLSATATGEGTLTYQWRKNQTNLLGETAITLNLSNVQTNDAGVYSLEVTGLGGTTVSSNAVVTVIPKTPGGLQLEFAPGFFGNDYGNNGGVIYQGNPYCVATLTNGKVLVAGGFTHVNTAMNADGNSFTNGFRTPAIALLNSDGSADTGFQSTIGIGAYDTIRSLLPLPGGKILIGGQFTCTNGGNYTNLARLNSNGSLDTSFVASSLNNYPQRLLLQSDDKFIAQGSFSSVNGVSRVGVARFNNDGSFDATWPANPQPVGSVYDVEIFPNDDVLIGGGMSSIGGISSRKYLGLLNFDGTVDTSFNHGLHSTVNKLMGQPGGLVWCYGFSTRFTNSVSPLDVTTIPSVIRLWPDGALASVSPTNFSSVNSLFSQKDGKMVVSFYDSALSAYQLMRFNADGAIDQSFNPGTGFDSQIGGMDMSPSGDLYVVGFFSTVNGVPFSKFVKLFASSTNALQQIPVITVQPKSLVVSLGSNGVVRASALGVAPLNYSWLKDGDVLAGETNSSLLLANFSATNSGDFQLVASNGFGSITSSIANVAMASAPSITQNPPASGGATNGGTVTIPVGVEGSEPFAFQWYRNNASSFGRTNNPLVISNFSSGFNGDWKLVVSNAYGSATSSVVNLQVGTVPSIFYQPVNQNLYGTGNVSMVVGANGSTPLSFQWFQNDSPLADFTTNSFTITNAVPTNAGIYYVVVSNFVGTVTSLTRTVTVINPFISKQPTYRAAPVGSTTNFSVGINGTEPITYSWYRKIFGPIPATNLITSGSSSNLVLSDLTRSDAGSYFVVASNIWGSVTSSLASLNVEFPPAITNMPVTNLTVEIGQSAYAPVLYEGQPSPTFTWFKDGVIETSVYGPNLQYYSAQVTNSGTYQLVLSNYLGSVTSAPIVLAVKPARGPTITTEPSPVVTGVGKFLSFNVEVDGSPTLQYRWFRDGTPVTGWQTYGGFSINSATTNDIGDYQVIITNSYGSATSIVASASVVVPTPANPNGKQFVKIADSTMLIPGLGTNRFSGFGSAFIVNGEVWFGGGVGNVPFSGGVYHWSNNVIESLVNTNAAIPGGSGTFSYFYGSTYLSDGKVIFAGRGSSDQNGIYAWTNGTIIKLYDKNTTMPGRAHTFENFGWPTVVGNQFAFLGFQDFGNTNFNDDYRGIYVSSNSVLTKLADTNDILPGVGYWRASSSQVAFDGDKVAWWGIGETGQGIYTVSRTAPITPVADSLTVNPASGANFDGFTSPPDSVPGRTYFVGHDEAFDTSFYYGDTGGIHLIAKPGDPAPGRSIVFDYVAYPSYAATPTGVYFDGLNGSYGGIFYWNGTSSTRIIDTFETLDGLGIQYVYVADANNDSMLFTVGFTNGKQALYAWMPTGGQSFNQWVSGYDFLPGESDPEDDPDDDGVKNIFEYYLGGNPLSAASSPVTSGTTLKISGVNYPAITFVRMKNASGVTELPQSSSNVNFSDSLGVVVDSVVDLGNGTERVTLRSATSDATQSTQFLRIQLSIP